MAKGLCTCMRPLAESLKRVDSGLGLTDAPTLSAQIDSVMAAQVSPCLDALETRFQERLQEEEAAIRIRMADFCPEVVAAMDRAAR